MDKTFKSDSFLYLAFAVAGFASIAVTLAEKLMCIGLSVLILVLRSLIKKYLNK